VKQLRDEIVTTLLLRYDCKSEREINAIRKHEYATDHFSITTLQLIVEDLLERFVKDESKFEAKLRKEYINHRGRCGDNEPLGFYSCLSPETLIKEGHRTREEIELTQKLLRGDIDRYEYHKQWEALKVNNNTNA
jgi:hypothetical protein